MPEQTPMEKLEARVSALENAKVDWSKHLPELKSVAWSVVWLLTGSGGTYVMTRPPVEGQVVPHVAPVKTEKKEQIGAPVFKPSQEK